MEGTKRKIMEKQIPEEAYSLAQDYQLGQPLAIYRLPLYWLNILSKVPIILLVVVIGLFILDLVLEILGVLQLQVETNEEQLTAIQNKLIVGFFTIFFALAVIALFLTAIQTLRHIFPKYVLICSHGLICVGLREIDVTRWEEVDGLFRTSKRHYRLLRSERNPLSFGYPLEQVEELAHLIRQYIQTSDQDS